MTPDERVLLIGLVTLIYNMVRDDDQRITPLPLRPARGQRNAIRFAKYQHELNQRRTHLAQRAPSEGIHLAT